MLEKIHHGFSSLTNLTIYNLFIFYNIGKKNVKDYSNYFINDRSTTNKIIRLYYG